MLFLNMRTLKELLIILRDNAEVHSILGLRLRIFSGLCREVNVMCNDRIITDEEEDALCNFIMLKVRHKNGGTDLLYPPGKWRCRKRWLNEQIKNL